MSIPERTTTEHHLRDALSRATHRSVDTIPDDWQLEQDLQIDSLALAELVTDLEARLSVVIPDEVTGRLRTTGDLRALLARLTQSRTDAP
ncbi:acyl carrier protein [Streptomyces sp. NPDC051132]|uniref:acyl carrier protein n=1 Tax=unclassified Streptomyces TaxID=2593676 RepID=UPI0034211835